jgi:hypothetical protein
MSRARTPLATDAIVVTDPSGEILRIDDGASSLLNIGTAHRSGGRRNVAHFFAAERAEILADVARVSMGETPPPRDAILRPKERHPVPVTLTMTPEAGGAQCVIHVRLRLPPPSADPDELSDH